MKREEYLDLIKKSMESSLAQQDKAAKLLASIQKELENRDIAEVSTETLLQCQSELMKIERSEETWQGSCISSIYFETENENKSKAEKTSNRIGPQNKGYEQLGVDPLSLFVGIELLDITDSKRGGTLLEEIGKLRSQLTTELGYVIPNIRVMDSKHIELKEYVINIRSNKITSGMVYPDRLMISTSWFETSQCQVPEDAILALEPIYKIGAVYWLSDSQIPEILRVYAKTAVEVIYCHLKETLIQHVDKVLTHHEAYKLVTLVKQENPILIQELTPALLPVTIIREVIVCLLHERVCLKDILFVFECLTKHAYQCKEPLELLERMRESLAPRICADLIDKEGKLYAVSLPLEIENSLKASICLQMASKK